MNNRASVPEYVRIGYENGMMRARYRNCEIGDEFHRKAKENPGIRVSIGERRLSGLFQKGCMFFKKGVYGHELINENKD